MSNRYRSDPRLSGGDLPYRDGPPPARWDADRFSREQTYRAPPVIERPPPFEELRTPPRRQPDIVEQRYYEDDRYGPRGQRSERRYFEEEDYYRDPRAAGGAMVPFRPERAARPEHPPVPRPGLLRRQSSLDTFDRRPTRRYQEIDEYRVERAPPPRIPVPIPRAPSPKRYSRYDEKDYADIRVQDPDQYGDDGFREYREREWVTHRTRNDSGSRERDRAETIIEEKETIIEEKPYPRRGKTRMPKRLVHTKVLYDLGYPYYEEVREVP